MTDARIRAGDVVIDLVERGKMAVVERAAETVAEHRATEDYDIATYKAHPLLDVSDDETVWTCVYLPDKPTASFSGTYDFPESRLARIPIEEANQDLRRVQERQLVTVLETLFREARQSSKDIEFEAITAAAERCLPTELVDEVHQLVDVDETIGGDS